MEKGANPTQQSTKAVARSRELLERTKQFQLVAGRKAPAEEAADQFAAEALKSVLMPAPDGLNVFDALAPKPTKPKAD